MHALTHVHCPHCWSLSCHGQRHGDRQYLRWPYPEPAALSFIRKELKRRRKRNISLFFYWLLSQFLSYVLKACLDRYTLVEPSLALRSLFFLIRTITRVLWLQIEQIFFLCQKRPPISQGCSTLDLFNALWSHFFILSKILVSAGKIRWWLVSLMLSLCNIDLNIICCKGWLLHSFDRQQVCEYCAAIHSLLLHYEVWWCHPEVCSARYNFRIKTRFMAKLGCR